MVWFSVGSAAIGAALGFWILGAPWLAAPGLAAASSEGDRPLWWAWVQALEPWCSSFVTWGMLREFEHWKLRAGLSTQWQAAHWLSARCLLAALGAVGAGAFGGIVEPDLIWIVLPMCSGGLAGFCWPSLWLRRRAVQRRQVMARELPFMLDLLTLCVEAGLSLPSALVQVARNAPEGPLRRSLVEAAALERTGMGRSQWLDQWAQNTGVSGVRSLVLALAQADRLGMSLGPLLRGQAAQQRSERFLRAEKLALEAPVRMLFPMVLCIFPCTFLVIGFPVVVKFLQSGL
ncbi:MAG TPA: type II secretion system F family protein [Castellaniella sp.]|uniref:type II secretion system F family protein n=1 Tax=Castellaniella sp. TaxID=1955812 RepID=UPI002F0BF2F9